MALASALLVQGKSDCTSNVSLSGSFWLVNYAAFILAGSEITIPPQLIEKIPHHELPDISGQTD